MPSTLNESMAAVSESYRLWVLSAAESDEMESSDLQMVLSAAGATIGEFKSDVELTRRRLGLWKRLKAGRAKEGEYKAASAERTRVHNELTAYVKESDATIRRLEGELARAQSKASVLAGEFHCSHVQQELFRSADPAIRTANHERALKPESGRLKGLA